MRKKTIQIIEMKFITLTKKGINNFNNFGSELTNKRMINFLIQFNF